MFYFNLQTLVGKIQIFFIFHRLTKLYGFCKFSNYLRLNFQGWGCMLRAGQMFVAECLLRQRLGRNYVWSESAIEDERYTEILELFRDTHSAELSLQQVSFSA